MCKKFVKKVAASIISALVIASMTCTTVAAATLDVAYYAAANPDVAAYAKGNVNLIIAHYNKYGRYEGRKANANDTEPFYRAMFDAKEYLRENPDVVLAGLTSDEQAFMHFMKCGLKEGRRPNSSVNQTALKRAKEAGDTTIFYNAVAKGTMNMVTGQGTMVTGNGQKLSGQPVVVVVKKDEDKKCSHHRWKSWYVKRAATCEKAELRKRECKDCDETEKEYHGSPLPHSYNASDICTMCGRTKTAIQASCSCSTFSLAHDGSNHWFVCSRCGKEKAGSRASHDADPCTVCGYDSGAAGIMLMGLFDPEPEVPGLMMMMMMDYDDGLDPELEAAGLAGAPVAGDPAVGAPVAGDPAAGDPAVGAPVAGDPAVGAPVAGDPAAADPEEENNNPSPIPEVANIPSGAVEENNPGGTPAGDPAGDPVEEPVEEPAAEPQDPEEE